MFDFLKNKNKNVYLGSTFNTLPLRHSKNYTFIKRDKSIFDEIATIKNVQGFVNILDRLPNPDIILKNAGKTISVLSRLENHYQVAACIESRKAGTLGRDWELLENNCPKNHFEFYKEIFENIIDTPRLIEDILDTPMYGYNPIEILWARDLGYIIPESLIAKPHEWFYFNSEGRFFFKDKNFNDRREIDLDGIKFLLPRNKPKFKNPYGLAKLSSAFWNVAFINGGMEMWVKFSEKYAMPYMFGKFDRSMTKDEQNDFLKGLSSLVQDAIGLIPSDGSVEIVQTGNSANSAIYNDLITKCENNISKAILGATLTTDIGNSGSYAASNTHMEVREDIVQSDMKLCENTINRLIRVINRVNFNDDEVPVFVFKDEEDLGVDRAQRDSIISNLGVKFTKSYLTRTYGYQEDDLEIIESAAESGLMKSAFEERISDQSAAEKQDFNFQNSENADNIDIPTSEDFNISNPVEENISKIIDFFNKSRDTEEALNKLEDLYPELNSEELEKILTKVIFAAELKGIADVQQELKNGK